MELLILLLNLELQQMDGINHSHQLHFDSNSWLVNFIIVLDQGSTLTFETTCPAGQVT